MWHSSSVIKVGAGGGARTEGWRSAEAVVADVAMSESFRPISSVLFGTRYKDSTLISKVLQRISINFYGWRAKDGLTMLTGIEMWKDQDLPT